jgi:hypothetical protein
MTDIRTLLANLRRPRLLIRAARHGVQDYRRERDLRRLFNPAHLPSPEAALARLMTEEEGAELTRRAGDAAYSLTRHVDLLIALMAEARLVTNRLTT